MKTKIAIIGGGASGLFSAITALTFGKNVEITIFEQLNRVGKKLLATGNGRCNITNEFANATSLVDHQEIPRFYHGNNKEFALFALKKFSQNDLIRFFEENGLILKKEEDKYYPFSEQAGTIVDFLRFKCEMLGVNFVTECKITEIVKNGNSFLINGQLFDKVIVACGGKSSPHLGSDGSGYDLLKKFGHKTTELSPAITQIKTETEFVKQLKGIKIDALCSIFVNDKLIRSEYGQVLFADYGLSGPPIFQLSRIASKNYDKNCYITLDFLNEFSENQVYDLIIKTLNQPFTYPLKAENLLSLILNKRLGQIIVKSCGYKLDKDAYELSDKEIRIISKKIKNFKLNVKGVNGFQNAQVTAGGLDTCDFDDKTMQSKLIKNLYAIGEILDIDGDCGGFNLQWAFSSGYIAAMNAIGEKI
ncbi:MAG: NAD(P)/FAD-dependent oxidoreductase [Clostridia bacterium]|nr:NAD(P)/FAD-dependent oxidoreductase [Clostridia bacterium]